MTRFKAALFDLDGVIFDTEPQYTRYFEQKGISFTVWCFDTSWAPMLISDWDFTPTTQGRFFKAYLQGK